MIPFDEHHTAASASSSPPSHHKSKHHRHGQNKKDDHAGDKKPKSAFAMMRAITTFENHREDAPSNQEQKQTEKIQTRHRAFFR